MCLSAYTTLLGDVFVIFHCTVVYYLCSYTQYTNGKVPFLVTLTHIGMQCCATNVCLLFPFRREASIFQCWTMSSTTTFLQSRNCLSTEWGGLLGRGEVGTPTLLWPLMNCHIYWTCTCSSASHSQPLAMKVIQKNLLYPFWEIMSIHAFVYL